MAGEPSAAALRELVGRFHPYRPVTALVHESMGDIQWPADLEALRTRLDENIAAHHGVAGMFTWFQLYHTEPTGSGLVSLFLTAVPSGLLHFVRTTIKESKKTPYHAYRFIRLYILVQELLEQNVDGWQSDRDPPPDPPGPGSPWPYITVEQVLAALEVASGIRPAVTRNIPHGVGLASCSDDDYAAVMDATDKVLAQNNPIQATAAAIGKAADVAETAWTRANAAAAPPDGPALAAGDNGDDDSMEGVEGGRRRTRKRAKTAKRRGRGGSRGRGGGRRGGRGGGRGGTRHSKRGGGSRGRSTTRHSKRGGGHPPPSPG